MSETTIRCSQDNYSRHSRSRVCDINWDIKSGIFIKISPTWIICDISSYFIKIRHCIIIVNMDTAVLPAEANVFKYIGVT